MTTPDTTMDVTVEAGDLADAMAWVRPAAATRPRVPTLTGARLSIIDGRLRIEAHDGTRQARYADVPATGTTTSDVLSLLTSAVALDKLVAGVPSASPVRIRHNGSRIHVSAPTITADLVTMPVEDYPPPPALPEPAGTVAAVAFADAVTRVAPAASRDKTIPILSGIGIEASAAGLRLRTTDRFRITAVDLDWPHPNGFDQVVVPATILKVIARTVRRLPGDVAIGTTHLPGIGPAFGIRAGHRTAVIHALIGQLPDLDTIAPEEFVATVTVDRKALIRVLTDIRAVTPTHRVALDIAPGIGALTVRTHNIEENNVAHALPCNADTTVPVQVSFNPDHLAQTLKAAASTTAILRFGWKALDPTDPGVVVIYTDYRAILQPLRTNE